MMLKDLEEKYLTRELIVSDHLCLKLMLDVGNINQSIFPPKDKGVSLLGDYSPYPK